MKKKDTDELGIFNILLIGKNSHAISISDNIKSHFFNKGGFKFNIVEDIEQDAPSNSWFNEFIFDVTTLSRYNNIVISKEFASWIGSSSDMERMYMKKMLQSMNTIIVDISDDGDNHIMDNDIPQYKFNSDRDFITDLYTWIEEQQNKIQPSMATIRLIRSLCGKNIPYLGDVFGCLSNKKYERIIRSEYMRFDVPILFDEFCKLSRGLTIDELDKVVITRTSSALSMFFK